MMRLSKRPGLRRAGSSTSGRLVAAMIRSPLDESKPSISARSWLSVCSRSSFPPPNLPPSRVLPIASISSMKIMQGEFFFASSNRSLTRLAPTPTNISTNSEPDREKNGTSASPATAFASSVFPVPGGPTSSAPLGSFAPMETYFPGSCRNSTTSCRDSLASSSPATSLNVTPVLFCTYDLALLRPTPMTPPPLPIRPIIRLMKIINRAKGTTKLSTVMTNSLITLVSLPENVTPAFSSLAVRAVMSSVRVA